MNKLVCAASVSAAIAIAVSAFAAHGASGKTAEWLATGGNYHLIHAVAAITIARQAKGPAWLLLLGSTLFALTLYLMAMGLPRWLGAITPIGGVLMICGWLWVAYFSYQQSGVNH